MVLQAIALTFKLSDLFTFIFGPTSYSSSLDTMILYILLFSS